MAKRVDLPTVFAAVLGWFAAGLLAKSLIRAIGGPQGWLLWGLSAVAGLGLLLALTASVAALRRRTRGKLLLDCGPMDSRWGQLGLAAGGLAMAPSVGQHFGAFGDVLFALFAGMWLFFGTARLQICEHGIWMYFSLIPFREIRSYQWNDEDGLHIRTAGGKNGGVDIPDEFRDQVDAILAENQVAQRDELHGDSSPCRDNAAESGAASR